jgi:hypothetical protein
MGPTFRLMRVLLAILFLPACGPAEDPARAKLRDRLTQETPLSLEEVGRLLDDLTRTLDGKVVKSTVAGETHDLDSRQREDVFAMFSDRRGVFDEGVRVSGVRTLRVLNGPAHASLIEMDAARRLLVDTSTLQPVRLEFISGVAADEYVLDLVVVEP